jgi:hypothetical protein
VLQLINLISVKAFHTSTIAASHNPTPIRADKQTANTIRTPKIKSLMLPASTDPK